CLAMGFWPLLEAATSAVTNGQVVGASWRVHDQNFGSFRTAKNHIGVMQRGKICRLCRRYDCFAMGFWLLFEAATSAVTNGQVVGASWRVHDQNFGSFCTAKNHVGVMQRGKICRFGRPYDCLAMGSWLLFEAATSAVTNGQV